MFEKRPVEKVNTGKPVLCKKLLFYCCINCGGRNRPSSLHLSHVKSKKLRVVLFRTNRVDAGAAAVDVSLSKTGEINTLGWQKLLFRVFFDFFCGATEQRHIWRGATPVTPVSRQPKYPRMKQSHETIKSRWSAGNLSHDEKKIWINKCNEKGDRRPAFASSRQCWPAATQTGEISSGAAAARRTEIQLLKDEVTFISFWTEIIF